MTHKLLNALQGEKMIRIQKNSQRIDTQLDAVVPSPAMLPAFLARPCVSL